MRSILLRTWLLLFAFAFGAAAAECQVAPAVNTSKFDLRVGGEFSIFQPDYGAQSLLGFGAYADLDFHRWVGVEAEARSLFLNKYGGKMRTDTGGGGVRFFYPYRKFVPFAKGEIGFGSIDFPNHTFSHETMIFYEIGGGVDYRLSHRVSVRGEYVYQFWPDFLGGRGLNPYGANVGASYRFF